MKTVWKLISEAEQLVRAKKEMEPYAARVISELIEAIRKYEIEKKELEDLKAIILTQRKGVMQKRAK